MTEDDHFEVPDLRDPETQRAYQDSQRKFAGEDVPAMHLRERLFLQDLAASAAREANKTDPRTQYPLHLAYRDLVQVAAVIEAFLARQELSEQSGSQKKEVTSGD